MTLPGFVAQHSLTAGSASQREGTTLSYFNETLELILAGPKGRAGKKGTGGKVDIEITCDDILDYEWDKCNESTTTDAKVACWGTAIENFHKCEDNYS